VPRGRAVAAFGAALTLLLTLLVATPMTAAAAGPAPEPIVVGNRLVDARTGIPWQARGVNFPGFEYACAQGWGYGRASANATTAQAIASWHATAVRVPLNQDCWLGAHGAPRGGGRTAEGYRAAVAAFVGDLTAAGLVTIIDLHSWKTDTTSNIVGQRAMPDAASVPFWSSVATRFADSPSVIFDAFNEPYSRWNAATSQWAFSLTWECWQNGGCLAPIEDDYTPTLSGTTYPVVGMTAIVEAIRAAGATQPIILSGIDYANDLRGWLAHRPDDDQLIAGFHNYRGQRCQTPTCWAAEVAPVAAVVPVIAGEFGQTDGASDHLTGWMSWADAREIGYLAWAWWVLSGSPTELALLSADDGTPISPLGTALRAHLVALDSGCPPRGTPALTVGWVPPEGAIPCLAGASPPQPPTAQLPPAAQPPTARPPTEELPPASAVSTERDPRLLALVAHRRR
jgi:endoglucanase